MLGREHLSVCVGVSDFEAAGSADVFSVFLCSFSLVFNIGVESSGTVVSFVDLVSLACFVHSVGSW